MECSTGNHLFIVSRWLFGPQQQSASGFTCQRCLLTIDGQDKITELRNEIDARSEKEDSDPSRQNPRSKGGKSISGETQDPKGQ
jgi:hypothetical protein